MSTGGCPQVVTKKVELLKDYYNIVVVEWECVAWAYVVQRNRVIDMIGDKFFTLSENQEYDLFNIIDDNKVDYIMIEEFSETFMPNHIMKRLY
jgi:endo-1,4-beta-D-glucanase Y